MFLMGPCKQMRSMLQSGRWIASIVYLVAIAVSRGAAAVHIRYRSTLIPVMATSQLAHGAVY